MSLVNRFLVQLEKRGLSVQYRDEQTLLLVGPNEEKTPDVLAGCKSFKAELLKLLAPRIDAAVQQANNPANVVKPVPRGVYCEPCNSTVYDKPAAGRSCFMGQCPHKGKADGTE